MQPTHAEVLNTLVAARLLLSEEATWTKRTYARTPAGTAIDLHDRRAACFCMAGAVKTCAPDLGVDEAALKVAYNAVKLLSGRRGAYGIADFNDCRHTTLQEVQEALDLAICLAEPQY